VVPESLFIHKKGCEQQQLLNAENQVKRIEKEKNFTDFVSGLTARSGAKSYKEERY